MRLTSACPTSTLLAVACSALSLSGVLAMSNPVLAGDLRNGAPGGIRDYGGGGVPVPAPIAYEENFKWYVRGDVGTAFKNSGTIRNDGFPLGIVQPSDWHEQSIISFGFGRYITPSFRTEFTLDYRTERPIESGTQYSSVVKTSKSIGTATVTYTDPVTGTTSTSGANQYANNRYLGTLNEDTSYQNSTFLMSGFYDFNRGGKLRPYVGAGIGIAMHQVHQNGTATYTCVDSTVTTVPDLPTIPTTTSNTQPACNTTIASGLQQTYSGSSATTSVGYGAAAQLSAGLTYDLTPRTHWDTGYRMLWQSGNVSVASANGLSSIRIGDQINHEIRTGIRWDVW
jgi:opacity protein-like surface antigen